MNDSSHTVSLRPSSDLALLYREVFRFSHDGIAIIDLEGRYLEQNEAHHRLIGYDHDELRHLTPAIHLGHDQFQHMIDELKVHGTYRGEAMSRTKAGQSLWLEISAAAIRDESGHPVAYVGIKRDISDRNRKEAELKRRYEELQILYRLTEMATEAVDLEDVYTAALDAIQQALSADRAAILLFDPDGIMRFKAWAGLSDHYRTAVEGHCPWPPGHPAPRPILMEDLEKETTLGLLQPTILKEGIRALAFFPLIFHGNLLGKLMVYFNTHHTFLSNEIQSAQNIANHIAFSLVSKRDELRQHETSQLLQGVVEASPLAIIAVDTSYRIILWNRSAERMLGWSAEEVLGTVIPSIPPDKRGEVEAGWARTMTDNTAVSVETQRLRRDGSLVDVIVYWAPLKNMDGTTLDILGVLGEITERKHAEAERERLLAELRSEHEKLLATQAELNERIHELEQFEEVVVGRELKMIAIEKEIHRLRRSTDDENSSR
jgi:PAS domain S-box-containing protein